MSNYKDLELWKEAHNLLLDIYKITSLFPDEERYNLTSQIRRAVLSIPTNIAEGNGRVHKNEYINFLSIARGSAMEVEYLLLVSKDLGYIEDEVFINLNNRCSKIIYKISRLIKYLKQ